MADSRYVPNPWLNDFLKDSQSQTNPNEVLESLKPKILSELNHILLQVDNHHATTHTSDQSVYTGTTGSAYLHLHVALTVFKNDNERSKQELNQCLKLIEPALSRLKTHRKTFLCGAAGPLAIAAVAHHKLDQTSERNLCTDKLCSLYMENKKDFDELPSELLYGQAGYLYALLFVNYFIPDTIKLPLIEEVCHLILGSSKLDPRYSNFPLMYTWHDKHYLGAAHGLAGIISVLLQVTHLKVLPSRHLEIIKNTIDCLLLLQFPSGNFPSSLESGTRDRLVQWCHGAPGFAHMLGIAYKVFNDPKYLVALEKCSEVVWEKGLLSKGCGLCHGIAGNAYTFLHLYRITGHNIHLHRAIKFCEWCLTNKDVSTVDCIYNGLSTVSTVDRPFSLFEGMAGEGILLADMYNDAKTCYFPALEIPLITS